MKVYGARISYYTGKLEAYLRYRGIDYELLPTPYNKAKMLREKVGAIQMPIVEHGDQWMTDSTPIILHLDKDHKESAERPIIPPDPVVAFIGFLIEDYADEWLWRPAMYYRWHYSYDRELASSILADEIAVHVKAPRWMKKRRLTKRQHHHFVELDGVRPENRAHVEQSYFNALDGMSAMLQERPFLFGNAPSFADIGLMGPMFRHFGEDPTPQEVMRQKGPLVYEWVARMWAARDQGAPQFLDHIPDDAAPFLKEICETHLVQLIANVEAYGTGAKLFDLKVQGALYPEITTSRYRVWCLEELRRRFTALSPAEQDKVKTLLPYEGAEILWAESLPAKSDYNLDGHLPFGQSINVYNNGLPGG